jgi:hypothetical protein
MGGKEEGMKGWDEEAAKKAVDEFAAAWKGLTTAHPDCTGKLSAVWKECYGRCGHKRLGRIVLGQSVEEACKARGGKEGE